MNYRILILSRNDLKIIILGTVIGGIFQVISWKYLKDHPELLKNENPEKVEPVIETKKPRLRRFLPRGGAIIEITAAKLVVNIAGVITFVAQKGTLTGMILTVTGVVIKKIPTTALSTFVHNALPTMHSDLERKKYILVDGKKMYLDQCDQTFKYMFEVLSNPDIPFTDKKEMSLKILMDHLDLGTTASRIRFIYCIISILYIFSKSDISSYFLMMQNLIKAIKEGKISKRLARIIIRRLIKRKIDIDPELIRAAA
jgi:hypothetical protein